MDGLRGRREQEVEQEVAVATRRSVVVFAFG
jgi:hypothetical protein